MAAVAREGDRLSCNAANIISSGSPNVFINGIAVGRITDPTPGHPGGSPSTMQTGNPNNVFANNLSICIIGSIDNPHGGGSHVAATVTVGSPDVFIG